MADISHLSGLSPAEPLDLGEKYPANRKSSFRLPPHGRYVLRAPDSFSQSAFQQSKAGKLLVQIDPTVADGPHAGFQVRRARVSAKVFERDGQPVSQVGDYLMAAGYTGTLESDQDIADAIESTAGQSFEAELDWRAENYRTGFKVTGMSKFPKLADGSYQQWVEDPTEKGTDDKPLRLLASVFIRNFIPAATE